MRDWTRFVRAKLPPLASAPEREAEIVEEIAQQLEQAFHAAQARGAADEEAQAAAEAQIGDWNALADDIVMAERPVAGRLPAAVRSDRARVVPGAPGAAGGMLGGTATTSDPR
jgi:hypothetical protein